jgi:hypothetical protein
MVSEVYMSIFKQWKNKGLIKEPTTKEVAKAHKKISEFIESTYSNINTKKLQFQALTCALKTENKVSIAEKYSKISVGYAKKHDERNGNNEVHASRQKHYKTYDELVQIRDDLQKKKRNFNEEMMYIVLAFNTLQPPKRAEIADMKIGKGTEKENYIHEGKLYLNEFKTVKSHGKQVFELPAGLVKIIKQSLTDYPREFLLSKGEKENDKPMGYKNLWNLLYSYLGKGQSIDSIRSSYVSKYWNSMTYNEQEQLAKDMLTSYKMLASTYRKIE